MGHFGNEFVDVQAELSGGRSGADVSVRWEDLSRWERDNPNGFTLYFREGRYLLRRWREYYRFWDGDFEFPANALLWFDRGAVLVFEEARIVVRGLIRAPLWQIFRREPGLDHPIGQGNPLFRGRVLIEADLPAVHPEWWGAAVNGAEPDDLALRDAVDTATALRAPLGTTLHRNPRSGQYEFVRRKGPRRPPIPVLFSQEYRLTEPLLVGQPVQFSDEQSRWIQAESEVFFEFGVTGQVSAVLLGANRAAIGPTGGLKYIRHEVDAGTRAVLHLKNCFGATVDGLSVNADGEAEYGIFLEPTFDAPQMHSVAIRHCHIRNARDAQIQVGPPARVSAVLVPITVVDNRELGGPGTVITVEAPVTYQSPTVNGYQENGLDTPGLMIDGCLIECRINQVPNQLRAAAPIGIQLRASNGVANLITNCRFRGEATAFVDARATMALVENCDFDNQYFTAPNPGFADLRNAVSFQAGTPEAGAFIAQGPHYLYQTRVRGTQLPVYVPANSTVANLGFEEPCGYDVYLSAEPVRIHPFWERSITAGLASGALNAGVTREFFRPSLVEGAVAMHGCTSSSAMLFGSVRPGPVEGKRSERSTMILGCVHQPRWVMPPPVSSVQWGRAGVSPYRAVPAGSSPGYSGDPCFCVVGSYLEAGVEVFQGAAQCAAVAFNTRQERLPRTVVASRARAGVTAQTFVFGLVLALLSVLGIGCAQPSIAPAIDATAAVETGLELDAARADDTGAPRSDSASDVRTDVNRFPLDIPGTVPFDSYPPPSQQRRRCPVRGGGDPSIPAPRLVSPLSPLRMTSQRPTLTWELPTGITGAQIELCRDPCCATVLTTLNVEGTSTRPSSPLAAGVVFWRARGRVGERVGHDTSFTWEFGVPHRDSNLDTFKGPIHDFNGDGYDDVAAVVYPGLRVYWGAADGIAERRFNDYRIDELGQVFLSVGDVNSDGYSDVVARSHYVHDNYNYSVVRVFRGTASGMRLSAPMHVVGTVGAMVDVNGDGFLDLIGDAPIEIPRAMSGLALILFGNEDGFGGGRAFVQDPSHETVATSFGFAGSGGDVDGDGFADFYIADNRFNRSRGRLYYFRGRADGLLQGPSRLFDPPTQIEVRAAEWGSPYGIGDVNGDRLADLMVLSEDIQQTLIFGARTPDGLASHVIRSTYPTSNYGAGTGPAVDFDDDGVMDLYLGCAVCLDRDHPLVTPGRIVVMTNVSAPTPTLLREFEPPPNDGTRGGSSFGQPVLAIDLNGDGFDDLVSVDPEHVHLPFQPGRGYISVIWGGRTFGDRRSQVFGVDISQYDRLKGIAIYLRSVSLGSAV